MHLGTADGVESVCCRWQAGDSWTLRGAALSCTAGEIKEPSRRARSPRDLRGSEARSPRSRGVPAVGGSNGHRRAPSAAARLTGGVPKRRVRQVDVAAPPRRGSPRSLAIGAAPHRARSPGKHCSAHACLNKWCRGRFSTLQAQNAIAIPPSASIYVLKPAAHRHSET